MPPRLRHYALRQPSEPAGPKTLRPSGVRETAARHDSEAPTLPPPPSLRDVRDASAPIEELLYRFEVGDHKGALAAAESLLDQRLVPTLVVSWELVPALGLAPDAVLLLTVVDGRASLEQVLEASGMPLLDALRALCVLLDERVVALR